MELHPATLWEAISDAVPDRPVLVQGTTRRSWREFEERASRLAGALVEHGVGQGAKVGLLLYNSPEYLEGYFAALKVRAVPFNVNYRYTADEIAYLLANADADALVYHSSLVDVVAGAVAVTGSPRLLLEVDDGGPRLPGCVPYEDAIAGAEPAARMPRDPGDVTMVYTGGTTGMPKGVVTAVGPPLADLLQTVPPLVGLDPVPVDQVAARSASLEGTPDVSVALPAPPLMHGTGMGIGAAPALAMGGTVVLLEGRRFDAQELWDTVAAERVNAITVVGDAFARPMLAALAERPGRDLGCVRFISSSGAMFSTEVKAGLLGHLPSAMVIDLIAATEGTMGMSIATTAAPAVTGRFQPNAGVVVLDEDDRPVEPGSGEAGLVALPGGGGGYYKDDAKTAATFRVIGGTRYTIPGDFATVNADGTITLLGRGSSCINTAGEKVYPEEVEEVLKRHPGVEDALVFGVADERFGQTVAAVLSRPPGADEAVADILGTARETLASFKVPRAVVVVDEVPRTQVGKPDYPMARDLFAAGAPSS